MHDDVGASLTQIALLSDLAIRGNGVPTMTQTNLNKIALRARSAVRSIDEIVWTVSPQHDNLASLVEYVSRHFDGYLQGSGIRCVQNLPDQIDSRALPSEFRYNLFLILSEGVQNIVKHSQATTATLTIVHQVDDLLRVSVSDDGIGFVENQSPTGDGLRNMRERADALGAKLQLTSVVGQGCVLHLEVPLPQG